MICKAKVAGYHATNEEDKIKTRMSGRDVETISKGYGFDMASCEERIVLN